MRTWIIEHFSEANGLQHLVAALRAQNESVQLIDCTVGDSFQGTQAQEIFFFGSQELGEQLRTRYSSGLYLGHDGFLSSRLQSGPLILNPGEVHNAFSIPEQLPQLWVKYPQGFFIRPNSWRKHFAGQVVTPDNFTKAWKNITFYLEADIEVVISPLQIIDREYRLLCVNNQLVAASLYKEHGQSKQENVALDKVQEVFQKIQQAGILPDTECTVDIAEVSGEQKLIEFNPLSTSAIYRCNPQALIQGLLSKGK